MAANMRIKKTSSLGYEPQAQDRECTSHAKGGESGRAHAGFLVQSNAPQTVRIFSTCRIGLHETPGFEDSDRACRPKEMLATIPKSSSYTKRILFDRDLNAQQR
jgi:hypothetical protein